MSYNIAWSDRYAVHPCRIGLYNYGEGVPSRGKTVNANEWWKPEPASTGFSSLTASHASRLFVSHSLGNGTGSVSPGETVTSVCTLETCPWPKQLFLSEDVSISFTRLYSLELTRFPFDEQVLKVRIHLLNSEGFAHKDDYDNASVYFTLPSASDNQDTVDSLGSIAGWTIISLDMQADPDYPRALAVELRVQRDSVGVIFKTIIPVFAQALLITLVAKAGLSTRLSVLALSVVGAAAMMDPSFLGLPAHVEGMPFVQSLVLIHLLVVLGFLSYTLGCIVQDSRYELKVENAERAHKASLVKVWQSNASIFEKWAGKFGLGGGERAQEPAMVLSSPTTSKVSRVYPDGDDVTPVANQPDATNEEVLDSDTLLRAQAELLLCMPALFHRQDATRPPSIWTPFKELRPGILPEYNKILQSRGDWDRRMIKIVPITYLTLWSLDLILYFGIMQPTTPSVL